MAETLKIISRKVTPKFFVEIIGGNRVEKDLGDTVYTLEYKRTTLGVKSETFSFNVRQRHRDREEGETIRQYKDRVRKAIKYKYLAVKAARAAEADEVANIANLNTNLETSTLIAGVTNG